MEKRKKEGLSEDDGKRWKRRKRPSESERVRINELKKGRVMDGEKV